MRTLTWAISPCSRFQAAAKSPQTQRFRYIAADVSEHDYAERVVAEATVWNGGRAPDIVWCVAGLATPLLWAEARDAVAAARRNMDVNYFGAADMSAAILRAWLAPGDGPAPGPASEPRHLVFTASVLALLGMLGYAPYAPSKWALRGLADTLAQEVLLYPDHPVRVHLVCPGTITSPGLERENRTKPEITMELEKDEPPQTPDAVAQKAIAGLERGNYVVSVSLLGELMRSAAVLGGSPKNNWVVDLLLGWVVSFAYFFILWDMNGKVGAWAKKHGHPSTYGKKD